jgi:hypothetical protein
LATTVERSLPSQSKIRELLKQQFALRRTTCCNGAVKVPRYFKVHLRDWRRTCQRANDELFGGALSKLDGCGSMSREGLGRGVVRIVDESTLYRDALGQAVVMTDGEEQSDPIPVSRRAWQTCD